MATPNSNSPTGTGQGNELTLTGFTSVVVRFRQLATAGLTCAVLAHLAFLLIFWQLEVWLLAVFNLFSIVLYSICLGTMRFPALRPAMLVATWLEIIAHAIIATLAVGAESGFHYYLVALIPLVFIDPRGHCLTRMLGLAVLTALFIGLDLMNGWHEPWFGPGEQTLALVRGFNGLICFVSLRVLVNVYARSSRQSERELRNLASTDLLTGVCNRRSLTDHARLLNAERRTGDGELALVLADLDHFKQLNDRYGHAFGDQVLADTADLMNSIMRPGDSLARWGGEEFLILLTDADLDRAIRVAERVREAISEQAFRSDEGQPVLITATLGVTEWRRDEEFEACVSRADDALYLGKQKGRDRIEVA